MARRASADVTARSSHASATCSVLKKGITLNPLASNRSLTSTDVVRFKKSTITHVPT